MHLLFDLMLCIIKFYYQAQEYSGQRRPLLLQIVEDLSLG